MADDSQTQVNPPASGLVIPDETAAKFSPLIELIKGSESMNDEERQYWINILPIMTPEQLKNLEDILTNEKTQLAAIDAKYNKQSSPDDSAIIERIEIDRRSKRAQRSSAEEGAKSDEVKHAEDVMSEIEKL